MTDRPHLAWPMRRAADGTLAAVEQDSLDDVRQCVHVTLRTPLGVRPLAPLAGIPDPTFTQGTVEPAVLERQLTDDANEPRARVTVTTRPPVAPGGHQQLTVRVDLADTDPTEG